VQLNPLTVPARRFIAKCHSHHARGHILVSLTRLVSRQCHSIIPSDSANTIGDLLALQPHHQHSEERVHHHHRPVRQVERVGNVAHVLQPGVGDETFIESVFARTGITTFFTSNPGYNEGAILALVKGFQNGWFEKYDWVVRVNPDVLIKNDTFILASMADKSINGIFVDCLDRPCPAGRGCFNRHMHSDFFAIRPSAVTLDALLNNYDANAERMTIKAFSGIVDKKTDAWLPGTGPQRGLCRVNGATSPVVHDHLLSSCNA
jgi:hypothetical protein